MQLDVASCGAAEVKHRRGPAQELLDRCRDALGLGLQQGELVGVVDQRPHGVGDGVPRGLVAGHHDEQEVVAEVAVRQGQAVLRNLVHQLAHEVGAVAALALCREFESVLEHLEGRWRAERQQPELLALGRVCEHVGVVGVAVAHHLIAPVDELAGALVGHRQHACEHADGEVGAHLAHEVEVTLRQRRVDRRAREAAKEDLVASEPSRRELVLQQLAQRSVPHAIGLEHRLAHVDLLVVELLDVGPTDLGRVRGVVARDGHDVGMPGY